MITSKQRAFLRKEANGIDPIFQIGKGGITEELLSQLGLALEARELIKVHILETALLDTKPTANEIAERLGAEPVQAIGSKFVLYKQAKNVKNRRIELPKK
ncbi:MAG: YhbY family RNA-binding protein [Clostridia bacterium]|nr:YhbY family RNA-binding protein [Clostridia bacterium]